MGSSAATAPVASAPAPSAAAVPPGATAASRYRPPVPGELFAYGGLSCVIAAICTNPLDVAKTQLQIQGELAARASAGGAAAATAAAAPKRGMAGMLLHLVRAEGPGALFRGVKPSMLREATYSTIRYGAYEPIKQWLQRSSLGARYAQTHPGQAAAAAAKGANETAAMPMALKILAGGMAGALGAAGATPSDLIKVRAQAGAAGGGSSGGRPAPQGLWAAAVDIYRHEGGIRGLYRGVGPTTLRAAMLTATQLPVYDHAKFELTTHPLTAARFKEGNGLHFACSMVAGVACATVVAPVDLVKSRFMNQPVGPNGKGLRYTGMADCLAQTIKAEGVLALWKGWLPSCVRLGPHTCLSLLVFEHLRSLAGLSPI